MIQRIQTVYLVLGSIFLCLLLISGAFSFGAIEQDSEAVLAASVGTAFEDGIYAADDHVLLVLSILLAAIIGIVSIFMFKNRSLQMSLTKAFMVLAFLVNALSFFLMYQEVNMQQEVTIADLNLRLGAFLPLLAMLMAYLALKNIRKDDQLVKSMDRLR
jgi:hypothetical protein